MNTILLLFLLYIIYLFIIIAKIPKENYDEYVKFKGSGLLVIMKDGKPILRKYKTKNDTICFLNNIRTIK